MGLLLLFSGGTPAAGLVLTAAVSCGLTVGTFPSSTTFPSSSLFPGAFDLVPEQWGTLTMPASTRGNFTLVAA